MQREDHVGILRGEGERGLTTADAGTVGSQKWICFLRKAKCSGTNRTHAKQPRQLAAESCTLKAYSR